MSDERSERPDGLRANAAWEWWIIALLLGAFILSLGPLTAFQWVRHGLPTEIELASYEPARANDRFAELDKRLAVEERQEQNRQIVFYSLLGASMFTGGGIVALVGLFTTGHRAFCATTVVLWTVWLIWAWFAATTQPDRALPPVFL